MPVRRNHITCSEQEEYLQAAQELRVDGVAIDIPEEWEKRSRCFDISIAPVSTIDVRPLPAHASRYFGGDKPNAASHYCHLK